MPPLRLGLNMFFVGRHAGGVGRYSRELTRALLELEPDAEVTVFVSRECPLDLFQEPWGAQVRWVRLQANLGGPPGHVLWQLMAQTAGIVRAARHYRLDVVHGLANVIPLVAPGFATVVTIHDLLWLNQRGVLDWRATLAVRLQTFASARRATRVITDSRWVAEDLARHVGLDLGAVTPIPLGVAVDGMRPAAASHIRQQLALSTGPLVLCVAQKRRHKNLDGLVRALARIQIADAELVLVGQSTPYEEELKQLASDLGIGERVHLLDYVDERTLEHLYQAAACVAVPSLEEGFGLPVLEAMARGVPVASSSAASLSEIGAGAAALFDPHDIDEMASCIKRILTDQALREHLARRGRARAHEYTWERTAKSTLAVYREAIGQGHRTADPQSQARTG